MDDNNKEYYKEMIRSDRGHLMIEKGHLVGVLTFFIGDDDDKYLYNRVPWASIEDDPEGKTAYIDQFLVRDHALCPSIHRVFTDVISKIRNQFPQVERVKWIRIGAMFRKHGIKEGAKTYVHCKRIK
jgi:hypothetical protein